MAPVFEHEHIIGLVNGRYSGCKLCGARADVIDQLKGVSK